MGNVTDGRELVWREESPGLRAVGDATGATVGWIWTDDETGTWSRQDAADVVHGYRSFSSALRDTAYAARQVHAVDVDGEMSGARARELAGAYASPGAVGATLATFATFATTGVARADALRADIRAARADMVRAAQRSGVLAAVLDTVTDELDRLATYVVNNR